jgi:hypothetical protein
VFTDCIVPNSRHVLKWPSNSVLHDRCSLELPVDRVVVDPVLEDMLVEGVPEDLVPLTAPMVLDGVLDDREVTMELAVVAEGAQVV